MSSIGWYGGHTKKREDGSVGGAGGHLGINHTQGGLNVQALNIGGDVGWGGDNFWGARANATGAGVSNDPAAAGKSGFWGGFKTLDAGASAYHDGQAGMGELGYRADWLSAEVGYRNLDATSRTDRGMKIGGAVGAPSGAARWYNQDADGDGRQEYGFGLSAPVPGTPFGVSMDYTTETPIGDALSLMTGGVSGLAVNAAMDWMGLGEYAPGTLMQDAAESVWDWGSDAASSAGSAISDGWDSTTDAVGDFFEGW